MDENGDPNQILAIVPHILLRVKGQGAVCRFSCVSYDTEKTLDAFYAKKDFQQREI